MKNTLVSLFLSFVFLQLYVRAQAQLVPGFHVFGDSHVDAGNSNFLNTTFQADFDPYGIDFVVGETGRFSNGLTIFDFLAQGLGVDPSYGIVNGTNSTNFYFNNNQAFNFAYGTAGILPETGEMMGDTLNLGHQVQLFKQAAQTQFPQEFKTPEENSRYLATSLFGIFIGSNDYIHNYLQPTRYTASRQYNSEKFADLLVSELGKQLQELYDVGARKMVVAEIPPLGCFPVVVALVKSTTRCAENVNTMVSTYNAKLAAKVKELSSTMKDSTIIIIKTYDIVLDMINNSSTYGFEETAKPCCEVGKDGSGLCTPQQTACEMRNKTLFWDQAHISQAANQIIAVKAFNGSGLTYPTNILDSISSTNKPSSASSAHRVNSSGSKSGFNILVFLTFFVVFTCL